MVTVKFEGTIRESQLNCTWLASNIRNWFVVDEQLAATILHTNTVGALLEMHCGSCTGHESAIFQCLTRHMLRSQGDRTAIQLGMASLAQPLTHTTLAPSSGTV